MPIDVADVERLLAPWRGDRSVTNVVYLTGGLMNRNYRVRVGSDDVVLRFYDRDPRAGAKETALIRALRGSVAVPEVLYASPSTEPVSFAVLEHIDGVSLRRLKQLGDASAIGEASYDAGRQLALLPSVALRDQRLLDVDLAVDDELRRSQNANAQVIGCFLESPLLRARLGDEHVSQVRDFAWQHDERLSTNAPARTVAHGDFNAANILVREQAGHWRVAAILDWEFAFAGPIYYDIGNFLRYERASRSRFEPSFSRGLADGGIDLPHDWLLIARLADLAALCELLTRASVPQHVADDVRALVLATIDGRGVGPS